ncbi:hypothetical protein ACMXZI_07275 [Bacillus subtilis]|uniref:Uncharacterized protein n=1 Tax=Bacillus subtilis TaxID=1423 RepID=A0AAQ3ERB9_BACIU|nr:MULTISPECIES: hypothetical protein [Bacillus]MDP4123993.1 hypothetical protein [Bacillota bacterium]WJD91117.1 hypothetical protein QR321_13320 [Bacillus spizizenii]MCP6730710.1 hypothetical protein [Bacillus subtilis]MCV2515755.1 hypothetical protein [Bacillus subtilis]MDK7656492.1 hypothetical protein [Bacillus subtilis]
MPETDQLAQQSLLKVFKHEERSEGTNEKETYSSHDHVHPAVDYGIFGRCSRFKLL